MSDSEASSSSSSEARPQQNQSQANRRHGLASATKQDLSAIAAAVAATSFPTTKQPASKQPTTTTTTTTTTTQKPPTASNEPTAKETRNQCPFCRGKSSQAARTAEETAQLLSRPSLRQQMLDAMVSSQRTTHERFNPNSNSNLNFNNRSEDADYQKYATAQLHRFLDSDFLPRLTRDAWSSLSADSSLGKQDNEEESPVFQVTRAWAIKADQFTLQNHNSPSFSLNKDDQEPTNQQQQQQREREGAATKQFHRKGDDFDKQHSDRRTPNALRIRAEKTKKEKVKKDESDSDSDSHTDKEERKRVLAAIAVDGASIQKQARVGAK